MNSYNEEYPYIVELEDGEKSLFCDYVDWCIDTFGNYNLKWCIEGEDFYEPKFKFKVEEDRNWFLLRWSGVQV